MAPPQVCRTQTQARCIPCGRKVSPDIVLAKNKWATICASESSVSSLRRSFIVWLHRIIVSTVTVGMFYSFLCHPWVSCEAVHRVYPSSLFFLSNRARCTVKLSQLLFCGPPLPASWHPISCALQAASRGHWQRFCDSVLWASWLRRFAGHTSFLVDCERFIARCTDCFYLSSSHQKDVIFLRRQLSQ